MKKKPASDALDRTLTALHQTSVPESFKASWRDAVKREEPSDMKSTPRLARLKRAALPIAAAAVLIIGTAVTGIIVPKTTETAPTAASDTQNASNAKTSDAEADLGYGVTEEAAFDTGMSELTTTVSMSTAARTYADDEDEARLRRGGSGRRYPQDRTHR